MNLVKKTGISTRAGIFSAFSLSTATSGFITRYKPGGGRTMTEGGYNSVSITLPDELVEDLDQEAENTGRSRSEVARSAIADRYGGKA